MTSSSIQNMARFMFLFTTLGQLISAHVMEHQPQRVLGGDLEVAKPSPNAAEVVREKLKDAEIIPTVIDDFAPSLGLHATWPTKERALLGNTLKPEDLQDEPAIALHDIRAAARPSSASNVTYVITLTDPDAPTRDEPKWSEFCHWIASGTLRRPAPCDPKHPAPCPPLLTDLDELVPYKPPGPPAKTGAHRYVFLAFVPSNGTTEKLHLTKPAERKRWGHGEYGDDDAVGGGGTKGVRQWAAENGLAPVGANFIYAQNKKQ